jgi:mevalonate kinase
MRERYYSKVILFGEYSMIFDATALMIPLKKFSAQWRFASHLLAQGSAASNASLQRFADYLSTENELKDIFDLPRFNHELYYNLFLDSNVPSGYGLGSSGTLVAAVYDAYAKQKTDDLLQLKALFSKMESYFHGSSSGIDPLQCYLGQPFKITPKGVELLSDDFLKKDIHICLIDTKIKSNTKPLVNHFKEQRKNPEFLSRFQSEYVPCVTACIEAMIQGDTNLFFNSLKQLTQGQLEFLRPMITDNTMDLFTADYDFHFGVKISGSGGGGYVLGFTDDVEKANRLLSRPCHFEAFDGIDTLPRSSVGMTCHQKPKKSMGGGFDVIWL